MSDPGDSRFARCSCVGGMYAGREDGLRTNPITLEWHSGGGVCGDFCWPSLDADLLVGPRLNGLLTGWDDLGVHAHAVRTAPTVFHRGRSRLPGPRIQAPEVTDYYELRPHRVLRCDPTRTTLVRTSGGSPVEPKTIEGVEHTDWSWDPDSGRREVFKIARRPGCGVYIAGAIGIFRVTEWPLLLLCTDNVKDELEARNASNILFLEYGESI